MNAHRKTDAVVEAMPTRKTKVRAKPSRGWSRSVFRMKRGRPRTREILVGGFIIYFSGLGLLTEKVGSNIRKRICGETRDGAEGGAVVWARGPYKVLI